MARCAIAAGSVIPADWCGATLVYKFAAVVQIHQPQVSQAGPAASVRCKLEAPEADCHVIYMLTISRHPVCLMA